MDENTHTKAPSGPEKIIWTVGYAGHDRDSLLSLFRAYDITAVADIRTFRGSSYWKDFDASAFGPFLRENGIAYVFMGDVLGGKPQDPALYPNGQLDYDRVAAKPEFQGGIDRLLSGAGRYRICLMCAEKDPLDCHRTLLIAPALKALGFDLRHLVTDGQVESQADAEARMLAINVGDAPDLFATAIPDPDAEYKLALHRQITRVAPKAEDAIKRR